MASQEPARLLGFAPFQGFIWGMSVYTGVVDRKLGDGKRVIIAKAHCDDKRAFDATRNSDYEPFQIKECRPEPTAC